jgi:carboxypeptidase C (cathepsin A)
LGLSIAVVLCFSASGWGQGGRGRGQNAAQQAPANATGGRGGRGGGAESSPAAAAGNVEFYNFDPSATSGQPVADSQPAETHQKITLNGQTLAYTTHAGFLPLHNATTGQSEAHLFYTSYAKDGVSDSSTRPLIFFLGGAPGVSAAWQEFGGLGPKRAAEGAAGRWNDNAHTLLAQADLVFVNPVGTGYSRPDRPDRGPAFWNTAADVASLAEFVRSFVVHYDRRGSPLFLAGEDFGTGRAAGLANYLVEHQVPVRGVVLLSMTLGGDAVAGDTQYLTMLPSYIMAAWQHKKLSPELNRLSSEEIAGQARRFASREYLHALYKGDRMTAEERTKAAADLSRLTGLSKAFLVSNDLRVPLERFKSELLREQHHVLSNSDARVGGYQPAPVFGGGRGAFALPPPPPIDFNISNLSGGFLTAYESYLSRELTFKGADGIFYLTSGGVGAYTSTGNDDVSLASAFAQNPSMRLFVSVNYFDLNSPFYAAEYALAHMNVAPEVRSKNITVSHLEAGGMPYLDSKALAKLHGDLAGFVEEGGR